MTASITPLFGLYILTPGRRLYALARVRPLAEAHELEQVVEAIDAATVHDRGVLELDARRRRGPNPVPPSARRYDAEIDQTLHAIDQLLSYRAAREEDEDLANTLHAELFPEGVGVHVRLPHVEQLWANERVLGVLESEVHVQWLVAQGFGPLIEDLRNSHDAFVDAMEQRDNVEIPTYAELRRERLIGQELYLRVVSEIVVACFGEAELLAQLLDPILSQNREVRALRRRRRSVPEIEPDSGELLETLEGLEQEGGAALEEPEPAELEPSLDDTPADAEG